MGLLASDPDGQGTRLKDQNCSLVIKLQSSLVMVTIYVGMVMKGSGTHLANTGDRITKTPT